MITDTKAAERLAGQLALTKSCPPGEHKRRSCSTGLDLCLDARAVACWLGWARRDDEARTEGERPCL